YLLMEDCGETIGARIKSLVERKSPVESVCKEVSDAIRDTAACLAEAAEVGVLHRDVSLGNITLHDGEVRVIDWGYAKLLYTDSSTIQQVANEWGFNLDKVKTNEDIHDGITGTPLFMSIRVLFGSPKRSMVDDLESLFYVALYVLSLLSNGPDVCPGFALHENRAAAFMKLGLLVSRRSYLEFFGVEKCSDSIKSQLDALYQLLFCPDGRFIGDKLIDEKADVRHIKPCLMREIIGDTLVERIYGEPTDTGDTGPMDTSDNMSTEESSSKRKIQDKAADAYGLKKSKAADNDESENFNAQPPAI
ncbi:hypothetical protein GGF43_006182, partial [Coemansia sp. RSA 2618]